MLEFLGAFNSNLDFLAWYDMFVNATENLSDNDFYSDDLITGCEDADDGVKLIKNLSEVMHQHVFRTHKWSSNNEKVRAYNKQSLELEK